MDSSNLEKLILEPKDRKSYDLEYGMFYGLGKCLKEYVGFPHFLPISFHMDHGPAIGGWIKGDFSRFDKALLSNNIKVNLPQNHYSKVYNTGAPYVHYRHAKGITKVINPKGTIFFVFHSTKYIDIEFDLKDIVNFLKQLPEKFLPISICLHHIDIEKGLHHFFLHNGFKVVTAGHSFDENFPDHFYSIIRDKKYAMSNGYGSQLHYCIEFGIPYSLIDFGDVEFVNKGNSSRPLGRTIGSKDYLKQDADFVLKAQKLFNGIQEEVTEEQKNFSNYILGLDDYISRRKLRYLLWKELFVVYSQRLWGLPRKFLKKTLKSVLKNRFSLIFLKKILGLEFIKPISIAFFEDIRLSTKNRFKEEETYFLNKKIKVPDVASFNFIKKELFNQEIYKFSTNNDNPLIIDCGANIGLSVIYFKKLYPNARVIAFEPDKKVFEYLKYNIHDAFGFKDIELIQKGLWDSEKTLRFYGEGADGGRIMKENELNNNIISIETIRLREYLNQPVDFLKIDIEGAEIRVLKDCRDLLSNVSNLFVEYHSFINEDQELDELLAILRSAGFRYNIHHIGVYSPNPFEKINQYLNMDLQLNIYAYRA